MPETTTSAEIGKLSVRNGLIIGGISVFLSIVYYIIDPLLQFTNIWMQLLGVVIVITLKVILAIDVRKKIGGFWPFGQAFQSLIIMSVFILLLSIIFGFILFKYVDTTLPVKISDATMEITSSRLEKLGVDQAKIDETMKPFSNGEFEAKLAPTFKNELTNMGWGLLIYAIVDLIIAACIKKNRPLFAVDTSSEVVE
jgi:hypothetical protein